MTYRTDHQLSIVSRLRSVGLERRRRFTDASREENCFRGDSGAALSDDDELYPQVAGWVGEKKPRQGLDVLLRGMAVRSGLNPSCS